MIRAYLRMVGPTLIILSGLIVAAGCGQEGPPRYDVSGTVTYKGEAVPAGMIQFIPDNEKGNSGPAGNATIEDGTFDTAVQGVGTIGGPHKVIVDAYDGEAQGQDFPNGLPIFRGYETEIELPEEATTIEIEIPQQEDEIPRGGSSDSFEEQFGVDEA
ncbi:MAG: hypothetical protein ACODAD_02530 [Planctomycetota bacterium]